MAFNNSSSVINGAVTTLMIALVTGIAIAAFVVLILNFCKASFSSSAILSGFAKTVDSSSASPNLWV